MASKTAVHSGHCGSCRRLSYETDVMKCDKLQLHELIEFLLEVRAIFRIDNCINCKLDMKGSIEMATV